MTRTLRATLVAIVMTNLAFAYITDAARWIWLGPFMVLTLASPWLARWADRWWFRGGWNLSVLGGFALLVHDTTTTGAAHLLEDGLLLATLAQVHLLNNIGRIQKPDVLFFNSFLIALVTSFLSVDVGFCLVFVAYASLLILGLQLLSAPEAGARGALARTAVVLGCTLVAFFLTPRDFHRRGLFAESNRLRDAALEAEVDFSPEVSLGELAGVTASNRIVLQVHLREGERAGVPQHWRGATLDLFDGRRWRPAREGDVQIRHPWRRARTPGTWVRGRDGPGVRVEVERLADTGTRLPVPLGARTLQLSSGSGGASVRAARDLTFRSMGPLPTRYEVGIGPESIERAPGRSGRRIAYEVHATLHDDAVPRSALRLAEDLRRQSRDLRGYVERVAHHLRTHYAYLAPGSAGAATSLDGFLRGDAGGHCEYFASAMVVLLRLQLVPCRLVTGYRSDEWDAERDLLVVRARHAHAWVEVLDDEAGWVTFDPTPSADSAEVAAQVGAWTRVRYWLSDAWQSVAGFNPTIAADSRLGALLAALVLLAGFLLRPIFRRARGRRRVPGPARRYARTLRRLGLRIEPGETPRDVLRRADLEPGERARLVRATEEHELARYAATMPMSVSPGLPSNG